MKIKVCVCAACGRSYETTARNTRYCSPDCQQYAKKVLRAAWKERNPNYYKTYEPGKRAKSAV